MGLLDLASQHEEVVNSGHEATLSHELIAAAASYEAAKAYEEHKEKNGEEVEHAKAKEFMAAAAGLFIDRFVETRGLDYIDKLKAKQNAEETIDTHYEE